MPDSLLNTPLPLVAAPMAGGTTTPALARAAAAAGAFPFLPGGYRSAAQLHHDITGLGDDVSDFGVNLFVPGPPVADRAAFAAYAAALEHDARRFGVALDPEPRADDDAWTQKVELLLTHPVPVVSLTFGLPQGDEIAALQAVGTRVLGTVTGVDEARAAQRAGVDGLVVQGPSAGGHSATFDPARTLAHVDTEVLVERIRAAVDLPVIAGGGVDGPAAVRRILDAGATAVSVGTMLLRTDEAGTSPVHRRALVDPAFTATALTRVFTGRPARALRNRFVDEYAAVEVTAYPAVHHLTRRLRLAAAAAGDPDMVHLWAGTGWRHAPQGPAAAVLSWLAGDAPAPGAPPA
ncbi:nitronate monooxygenase [Microbacterium sp. NPDC089189]|uniref:NAD(P)H-dependent flavin oxidoreductase n=1 Tax=Microbacterium sp. NPDC089189 TaxID=3154972 RepID=UPI00341E1965